MKRSCVCVDCDAPIVRGRLGRPRMRCEVCAARRRSCSLAKRKSNARYQKRCKDQLFVRLAERDTGGVVCCSVCHVLDQAALSIDHVDGSGREQRRQLKAMGGGLYVRIKSRGLSIDNLRILCLSCQFRARVYGPDPSKWPAGAFQTSAVLDGPRQLQERKELNFDGRILTTGGSSGHASWDGPPGERAWVQDDPPAGDSARVEDVGAVEVQLEDADELACVR